MEQRDVLGRGKQRENNWDNCNSIINEVYFKKLKMDLPFEAAIPFCGIYPKEPKTLIQKNISTPLFIAAFIITKTWKCPSVDEWIKLL